MLVYDELNHEQVGRAWPLILKIAYIKASLERCDVCHMFDVLEIDRTDYTLVIRLMKGTS
ncbi:MAG: hypothetical protein RR448_09500 [Niameybacter sp.]|uniref:hypothetical protein n=1 Tax=Niameybacter sp. TaxID=2033640 RepID=UPI002FCBFC40